MKIIREYLKLIAGKAVSFLVSIIPVRFAIRLLPRKICFFGHIISDDDLPAGKRFRYPSFRELDEFIDLMRASGYDFVSYRDYLKRDDRKKILLTFDDGLKEIYTRLHPYMMKKRIPYMIFVLTASFRDPAFITEEYKAISSRGTGNYLSREEAERLRSDGVDIGFHTDTHFRISDRAKASDEDFIEEIKIEDKYADIFTQPLAFAYPFAAPKKYKEFDAVLNRSGFVNIFDTRWWLNDDENHFSRWPMDIKNEKIECDNCMIFHIKKSVIRKLLPLYLMRR